MLLYYGVDWSNKVEMREICLLKFVSKVDEEINCYMINLFFLNQLNVYGEFFLILVFRKELKCKIVRLG